MISFVASIHICIAAAGFAQFQPGDYRFLQRPENALVLEDKLDRAQQSLNLCRDAIPRVEAIPGDRAKWTAVKFKLLETRLLAEIAALGGKSDQNVGMVPSPRKRD